MDLELSEAFDLIVVGTGFSESCVAAAASRIGKTVLHIDPNDFYGGSWSSFNLESFQEFLDDRKNNKENTSDIKNVIYEWHLPAESETKIDDQLEVVNSEDEKIINKDCSIEWSHSKIISQSRRFNIDLSPKILFSSGKLVELLISSNICRYAEFRAVDKIYTKYQNEIINVPCSRTDVFNTEDLTIVEKRLLMKLLNSCIKYDVEEKNESFAKFSGKLFIEYLKANHLTEKIIHCVLYAIAMCNESSIFEEGIERTKKFLLSLGRYGNTPFLFPMYGCGELPQCFCRLCAVFGGTYCLKKKIDRIEMACQEDDSAGSVKVIVEGKTISAKHVVLSHSNLPSTVYKATDLSDTNKYGDKLSRGVFITASPIENQDLNSAGGGVNLLRLITDDDRDAYVIQLSHYSGTCPKGLYLIHITTKAMTDNPETDVSPFLKDITSGTKNCPKILFSAYFTIAPSTFEKKHNLESYVHCTAGPFFELDYDHSIKNATDIFSIIYPNLEFLPRAPDPEEIIIDDEHLTEISSDSLV